MSDRNAPSLSGNAGDLKGHRASVLPDPELLNRLQPFREEALKRGIPSEDVERWIAIARPSGWLHAGTEGPVVGRFGGPLMLPTDAPDPYYPLLATLDCVALPERVTGLPLPSDGRLLLFGFPDMEYVSCLCSVGEVLYIPAGTPVEQRLIEKYGCFYREDGTVRQPSDLCVHAEYPQNELRLSADVTLPFHLTITDPEQLFPAPLPGHPRSEELVEAWYQSCERIIGFDAHGRDLRIGGFAFDGETEKDPVYDAARHAAHAQQCWGLHGSGEPCTAEEQLPAPEDWLLLAQWSVRLTGREGGIMHWVIPQQDLAERRFDRVFVSFHWNP